MSALYMCFENLNEFRPTHVYLFSSNHIFTCCFTAAVQLKWGARVKDFCSTILVPLRVTRRSTFMEILRISYKTFSNENQINCIELHEFSLFYTICLFSIIFPHIFIKNFNNFKIYSGHYSPLPLLSGTFKLRKGKCKR